MSKRPQEELSYLPLLINKNISESSYHVVEKLLRQESQNEKLYNILTFIRTSPLDDSFSGGSLGAYLCFLQSLCDCLHPELYHFAFAFASCSFKPFLLLNIGETRDALHSAGSSFSEHYNCILFFHFSLLTEKTLQEIFTLAWKSLNRIVSCTEVSLEANNDHIVPKEEQCIWGMTEGITVLIHSCIFFLLNKAYCQQCIHFLTLQPLDPSAWVTHFANVNVDETLRFIRILCAHLFKSVTTNKKLGLKCADGLIGIYVNISLGQRFLEEIPLESLSIEQARSLLREVRCWCSRALDSIYQNATLEQKHQKMIDASLVVTKPWLDFVNRYTNTPVELSIVLTKLFDEIVACYVFHLSEEDVALSPAYKEITGMESYGCNQAHSPWFGLTHELRSTILTKLFQYINFSLLDMHVPVESKQNCAKFIPIALIYLHCTGMTKISLSLIEKFLLPIIGNVKCLGSHQLISAMTVLSLMGLSNILCYPIASRSMQTYVHLFSLLRRQASLQQVPVIDIAHTHNGNYIRKTDIYKSKNDSYINILAHHGASCPLVLWNEVFLDDSMSDESLVYLVEVFLDEMPIDTEDIQHKINHELLQIVDGTSAVFWKINDLRQNRDIWQSGIVDQTEVKRTLATLARSIVKKINHDSIILTSSLMNLLPVNYTFDILHRIYTKIENSQYQNDNEIDRYFVYISIILRKSAYIIGSHEILKNTLSESLVSDLSRLRQHLENVFSILKNRNHVLRNVISSQCKTAMNLFCATTHYCFL